MADVSTKPYLIRAIHEWCADSGMTPYIAVLADSGVNVPQEFVKNGEIVLNISPLATNRLKLGNEAIEFQARFGGVAREVTVPVDKVIAVYARENGQGMAFDVSRNAPTVVDPASADNDGAKTLPGPTPMALVPVRAPVTNADNNEPSDPPPPPRRGDRPKLTRIK
ncbi:MAG TPA: ClpXP protease specificity-enhancing factor [Burkholderiaceae bacterium]|jgi:stringent starvation protein B|nr:ClpXP protease specificity-enhancing factor [Burkholderiaceae bacterium]